MYLTSKIVFLFSCLVTVSVAPLLADDGHEVYQNTSLNTFANVERHQLYSEALGQKRLIDIAVPVNYFETAKTHKYPVIVVMDAELLFPMVSGLIHQMTANSQMPESIIVGINNVAGVRRDITPKPLDGNGNPYWFGGQEDKYLQFIQDEALPFLEENYRAADFRIIIGLSPTAQFVLHSFWKAPKTFDGYVAINATDYTAVGYDGKTVFEKIEQSLQNDPERTASLYVSMPQGGATRNPHIAEAYKRLTDKLAPFAPQGVTVKAEIIDKSSYAATLPAVISALEMIYPSQRWDPDYRDFLSEQPGQTLQNVQAYFEALGAEYGFVALPKGERFFNRNRLKRLGYHLLEKKRIDEATNIFRYWVEIFPNSANAYDSLADALSATGQTQEAKRARIMAVGLARENGDARVAIFEAKLDVDDDE